MTSDPVVSVLVPAFNAESTVTRAVDSALAQTFDSLEVVVIDDGSVDGTADALRRYSAEPKVVVVTHDRNEGLVRALNAGLALCRGHLVARLDADDWALPTRIGRQVALFRSSEHLALSASSFDRVDAHGRLLKRSAPPATHAGLAAAMLVGNRLHHSSVMFRRSVALGLGGYDSNWYPVEDYDLWLRLLAVGEYRAVPSSESVYRHNPQGISATRTARQEELHVRRAALYRADLLGTRPRPDADGELLAREIARSAKVLRRQLRTRGIHTDGLDRYALRGISHALRRSRKPARAVKTLALAPRVALAGRLGGHRPARVGAA